MEVGVIDSADYNGTNVKTLTFPNYKDPSFTGKWTDMIDTVVMPVEELPSSGEEHVLLFNDTSWRMGVSTRTKNNSNKII